MNKFSTKLFSLVICFDMVLAPFPKAFADQTPPPREKPTVTETLQATQRLAETLFGPGGCAQILADGKTKASDQKISYSVLTTNMLTQLGIHDPNPDANNSLDCSDAVSKFIPVWNNAMDLQKKYEKGELAGENGSCPDCATGKILNGDFMTPTDGLCSKKDKERIQQDRKNKPSCSIHGEFFDGNSWRSNNGENGCAKTIWDTLTAGIKETLAGIKNFPHALMDWHSAAEKTSTDKQFILAGLSQAEITEAQKDPEAASRNLAEKALHKLISFVEFLTVDFTEYKEAWACSECGHRANTLCKMIGLWGKDSAKYYVMQLIMGAAFNKLVKETGLGAKVTGLFAKKVGVEVEKKTYGWITTKAIKGWETFMGSHVGQLVKGLAEGGWKVTTHSLELANDLLLAPAKGVHLGLKKIVVTAGDSVATKIASVQAERALMREASAKLANAVPSEALTKVSNGVETETIKVSVARVAPPESQKAAKVLGGIKDIKGKRLDFSNIENLSRVPDENVFVDVNSHTIKIRKPVIDGAPGEMTDQYIKVHEGDAAKVKAVHTFGNDSNSAIIEFKGDEPGFDGHTASTADRPLGPSSYGIVDNGVYAAHIEPKGRLNVKAAKEYKAVQTLTSVSEENEANRLAAEATAENARINGNENMRVLNESEYHPPREAGKLSAAEESRIEHGIKVKCGEDESIIGLAAEVAE